MGVASRWYITVWHHWSVMDSWGSQLGSQFVPGWHTNKRIDNWCTVHLKGKKSMDFKIPQRSESWWNKAILEPRRTCKLMAFCQMFIRMGCTAFRQLHNFLETPKYFRHWMTFKILNPIGVRQGVFPTCGFFLLLPLVHFTTLDLSFLWLSHISLFYHTHICVFRVLLVGFLLFFNLNSWIEFPCPGVSDQSRGWHRCCSQKRATIPCGCIPYKSACHRAADLFWPASVRL